MTGAEQLYLIGEYAAVMALASGIGAYVGSYLKRKAENLATHEDIVKLVDQVSAVTTATKQIEARISDEVWQRQTTRNDKKEVYRQALGLLGQMRYAVAMVDQPPHDLPTCARNFRKLDDLRQELYQLAPYAFLVLNGPAKVAFEAYQKIAEPALQLDPATPERWKREGEAIQNAVNRLIAAGREDLGF
jgi:hypothetical protein